MSEVITNYTDIICKAVSFKIDVKLDVKVSSFSSELLPCRTIIFERTTNEPI